MLTCSRVMPCSLFVCVACPLPHTLSNPPQASALIHAFDLDSLVQPHMHVSEDDIIAFADLALYCVKTPGTHRPDMKEVLPCLSTMIAELEVKRGGNISYLDSSAGVSSTDKEGSAEELGASFAALSLRSSVLVTSGVTDGSVTEARAMNAASVTATVPGKRWTSRSIHATSSAAGHVGAAPGQSGASSGVKVGNARAVERRDPALAILGELRDAGVDL